MPFNNIQILISSFVMFFLNKREDNEKSKKILFSKNKLIACEAPHAIDYILIIR